MKVVALLLVASVAAADPRLATGGPVPRPTIFGSLARLSIRSAASRRTGGPLARLAVGLDEHVGSNVPRELTFTDSQHRVVSLGLFFAPHRPIVLVMAYARCTMLCSVVLRGIAEVVRTSQLEPGRDYLPVVVSLDPRETADEAARRQNRLLDEIRQPGRREIWPYLVGDQPSIAALADALGFRYAWDPQTEQYAHPAVVFVIAPDGRIAEYLRGVTFDGLADAVARAARGELTSASTRDLLACFHFDPAARRYGSKIALLYRLAGALMLLTLLATIGGIVHWGRKGGAR